MKTKTTVNADAVANFLGTLDGMSQAEALGNLAMDARMYKWNVATVRAIETGIMLARLG